MVRPNNLSKGTTEAPGIFERAERNPFEKQRSSERGASRAKGTKALGKKIWDKAASFSAVPKELAGDSEKHARHSKALEDLRETERERERQRERESERERGRESKRGRARQRERKRGRERERESARQRTRNAPNAIEKLRLSRNPTTNKGLGRGTPDRT